MADRPQHRRARPRRLLRRLSVVVAGAVGAYLAYVWSQTPDVTSLRSGPAPVTRSMRVDAERSGVAPRPPAFAPLDRIAVVAACAVVKSEDVRFFDHDGLDWPRVWHAIRQLGQRGGASTITQQLARNVFLSRKRSLHRKMREAFTARQLETALDKPRILELYLNIVPLGAGVWGVEEAAAHYFGKSANALDAFESVVLASLIAAPNAALEGANLERVTHTAHRVLRSLHRSGVIDDDTHQHTLARLDTTLHRVDNGAPLERAMPAAAPAAPRSTMSMEEAVSTGCGLDRELAVAFAAVRRR